MPTTSIRGALSVMARAAWCTAVRATAPATPEMSASLMVFDMINLVATLVPWKLGVGSWKLGVGSWELTRSFPASDPLPLARRAAAESECRVLGGFPHEISVRIPVPGDGAVRRSAGCAVRTAARPGAAGRGAAAKARRGEYLCVHLSSVSVPADRDSECDDPHGRGTDYRTGRDPHRERQDLGSRT